MEEKDMDRLGAEFLSAFRTEWDSPDFEQRVMKVVEAAARRKRRRKTLALVALGVCILAATITLGPKPSMQIVGGWVGPWAYLLCPLVLLGGIALYLQQRFHRVLSDQQ
jgi:hypothetical protein